MSSELLYSSGDNLWLRDDGDVVAVGVPSSMLMMIGAPDFICLPREGAEITPGVPFGTLENTKSAFDFSLPFPCEVVSANRDVAPAALLAAADGELPLFTVRPRTAQWTDGLLDAAGYAAFIAP